MTVLEPLAATPLMGGMAGSGMGGTSGAIGLVPFAVILALAALVVATVVAVRTSFDDSDQRSRSRKPAETAVERLQRRYAEGELTEAEFERALEREMGSDGTTDAGRGPVGEPDPAKEAERAR